VGIPTMISRRVPRRRRRRRRVDDCARALSRSVHTQSRRLRAPSRRLRARTQPKRAHTWSVHTDTAGVRAHTFKLTESQWGDSEWRDNLRRGSLGLRDLWRPGPGPAGFRSLSAALTAHWQQEACENRTSGESPSGTVAGGAVRVARCRGGRAGSWTFCRGRTGCSTRSILGPEHSRPDSGIQDHDLFTPHTPSCAVRTDVRRSRPGFESSGARVTVASSELPASAYVNADFGALAEALSTCALRTRNVKREVPFDFHPHAFKIGF
jgi:hypothetical protein